MIDEAIELLTRQFQREKLVQDAEARGNDTTGADATHLGINSYSVNIFVKICKHVINSVGRLRRPMITSSTDANETTCNLTA